MHARGVAAVFVLPVSLRNNAVNLHLSDENADSTMLRWQYVFSNSSGFFSCHLSVFVLGPNPFTVWFLQVQITGLLPALRIILQFLCTSYRASSITHLVSSGTFLIISRNTGESCARPLIIAQDTIFLPLTSVTMCSLTNSHLKMMDIS